MPERRAGSWPDPGLGTVLDHVRWLAAWLVLLSHVRLYTIGDYGSDVAGAGSALVLAFFFVTGLGHEAVVGFFVLSGVLIAGRLIGRAAIPPRAYRDYLLDRFTRIWLVAIPALLLSAVVAHLSLRGFAGLHHGSPPDVCAPAVFDLTVNLLFLHKVFFPTLCSDGPYWSLHNEVWYYLLLPATLLVFTAPVLWVRGVMLALVTAAVGALLAYDSWGPKNTLAYLPLWLAGAAVAARWRLPLRPAAGAALLVIALLAAKAVGDAYFLIVDYLLGLALLALLLAVRGRGVPAWWLTPAPVRIGRRLAGFSYSLYLTHAPVIFVIRTVLERRFGVVLPIREVGAPALAIMLLEALAAIAVAWLFYLAFERHTGAVRAAIRARLGHRPGLTRLAPGG